MRVWLVMLDADARRSFADSKPVLVTTTGMLAALGVPGVGMDRFRPNIVLEETSGGASCAGRHRPSACRAVQPLRGHDDRPGERRTPQAGAAAHLNERFAGNFGVYCRVARGGCLRHGETLIAA